MNRLSSCRTSPSSLSEPATQLEGTPPAPKHTQPHQVYHHFLGKAVLDFDSDLRFYIPFDTKQIISEMFPANLLDSTEETKCDITKANIDPEVPEHKTYYNTTTTTILRPFFRDHPGEPVSEENFWTLWCKGRLTEADTPTIQMGTTPSGLRSAHLRHPPFFYRPDALPAAQPTVSKH